MQPHFPDAYRDLSPNVRARCRRMLGDPAAVDDVVQETFLRLWRAGPWLAGSSVATLASWLHRTCTRLSIDVLRARARAPRDEDDVDALPVAAPSPDDIVEARAAVAALASRVPPEELEAVLLARVDGLTQPEVASALGVSERTVRRLLDRFDARGRAGRLPVLALALALMAAALCSGRSCAAETGDARPVPELDARGAR